MSMRAAWYGLKFVLRYHFSHTPSPLIRGLVLTNRCNLHCQQCKLIDRGENDMGFGEAKGVMEAFYQEGGRCLYLEGGEPFIWRDGEYGIEEVVDYAHHLGFLTVVVYTNGTRPLRTSADTVFVSVDGLQATHDALRGVSFEQIMNNIQSSSHDSLYINYTINQRNKEEIRAFCEYVHGLKTIRGMFFYFHTPYYGEDKLFLDLDERRRIMGELLGLRKRYKILNSRAGLLSAMKNDWKRPLNICSVYEHGVIYPCCRYSDDPALCRHCGYLSYAEIDQTLKFKPSAMFNAYKYF